MIFLRRNKKRELNNGPPVVPWLWALSYNGETVDAVGQTAHQAYLDGVKKFTKSSPSFAQVSMKMIRELEKDERPTRKVDTTPMAVRVGTHIKMSGILTPPSCYNEKWCQELLEAADIMTGDEE